MYVFLAQDSWWQVLLGHLSEAGLAFAAPLLVVLGVVGIKWVLKKLKVEDVKIQDTLESAYEKLVDWGIGYAEEQAHKLSNDPKKGVANKLDMAADYVQKMIKEWGLPEKTSEWVEEKIEARLGQQRKESKDKS